jgi:hypothetical protein
MTTFEQTVLKELASLPKSRRTDVLAFIRFLKISLLDEEQMDREYLGAIKDARATAKKYRITEDIIDSEIRAVRDGK